MYVVNEEEEQILQMENTLDYVCSQLSDYKEKLIALDIAHGKRLLQTILVHANIVCS
jgi:hypothetical protein